MRGVYLIFSLLFCGTLLADVVVTRDDSHWKGKAVKELRYKPLRHVFLFVSGHTDIIQGAHRAEEGILIGVEHT